MVRKFLSLAILAVGISSAATITYVTPANSNPGGGLVDAEAVITTNSGSITVVLSDLLGNPTDAAQLISDLSLTLSGAPGTVGASSTPTGSLVNITGHQAVADTTDPIQPWDLSVSSDTVTLERLGSTGSPSELIIGPP